MSGLPKLLVINSKDKDVGSISNSDFEIQAQEKYLLQGISRIVIVEATVPNLFANINEDNNILDFKEAGGPLLQAFLPVGQYNVSQLISALESEIVSLVTIGNVPTITLDQITNKLIINMSVTGLIILGKSTIAEVIGTIPDQDVVNVGLQTLLPRIVNLSGLPVVYLHSKALSSSYGIDAGKGLTNLVVAIPLNDAPYGSYATLLPKDLAVSEIVYDSPRNITTLDIRLRDSQGKLLDIENMHITLVVKIYFS
jgi:hypothetical protein